jgi:hypothetical protein
MLDSYPSYNVTIIAIDRGGFTGFTNLNVYLNKTSLLQYDPMSSSSSLSSFRCSVLGLKSELNQSDLKTLEPKLFILVRF